MASDFLGGRNCRPPGGRIKDSSADSRNGWLSGPGRASPAGWIYKFPQLFANLRRHYIAIWGTPTWIDRRVISPNIKPRFAISLPSSSSSSPSSLHTLQPPRLQSTMNFLPQNSTTRESAISPARDSREI